MSKKSETKESEQKMMVPRPMNTPSTTVTLKSSDSFRVRNEDIQMVFPDTITKAKRVVGDLRSISHVCKLLKDQGVKQLSDYFLENDVFNINYTSKDRLAKSKPNVMTTLATFATAKFYKTYVKPTTVSTKFIFNIDGAAINVLVIKEANINVDSTEITANDLEGFAVAILNSYVQAAIDGGDSIPMNPKARVAFSDENIARIQRLLDDVMVEGYTLAETYMACNVAACRKPTLFVGTTCFVPELIIAYLIAGPFGNPDATKIARQICVKKVSSMIKANPKISMKLVKRIIPLVGNASTVTVKDLAAIFKSAMAVGRSNFRENASVYIGEEDNEDSSSA